MEDNRAILLKANEHITKGDHEAFLALCTGNVVWEFVGDQILNGKQAIREYMASVYIDPPEFDVKELIADDDYVVAIGRISLKDTDGNTVTSDYCDVWKFRDGKMASLKAFVAEIKS